MMRHGVLVLMAAWVILNGPVRGQEPDVTPPARVIPPAAKPSAPGCADGHPLSERRLIHREMHLVEKQEACTTLQLNLREVETRKLIDSVEIGWKAEERLVCSVELKPRVVQQQVTCYTSRLVEETDPCTGKRCTVCKQVPEVKTVDVTVYDSVPVMRVVVVRVPAVRCVPKELVIRRLVLEENTVPATRKTLQSIYLENEVSDPCAPTLPPLHCPIHK